MDSVVKDCTELKHAYETCFNEWYGRYLKGETIEDTCKPLFAKYHACLKAGLEQQGVSVDSLKLASSRPHSSTAAAAKKP
eukprot:m.117174 g.117174  ORF g.117174 m.117174 type:complete len:80 (+) comp51966_c1_seq1:393-632(+)